MGGNKFCYLRYLQYISMKLNRMANYMSTNIDLFCTFHIQVWFLYIFLKSAKLFMLHYQISFNIIYAWFVIFSFTYWSFPITSLLIDAETNYLISFLPLVDIYSLHTLVFIVCWLVSILDVETIYYILIYLVVLLVILFLHFTPIRLFYFSLLSSSSCSRSSLFPWSFLLSLLNMSTSGCNF